VTTTLYDVLRPSRRWSSQR